MGDSVLLWDKIDTLKNLVYYSEITIKGRVTFVKQVSKNPICVGFHHQWQFLTNNDLFLHHKACFESKTQNSCLDFLYTHVSVCTVVLGGTGASRLATQLISKGESWTLPTCIISC